MSSSQIFKDGVLVDVNVSYWSGAKSLKPEDLGLDPKSLPEAFKLGRKFLIPTKVMQEFRKIESRARRVVDNNSFQFPIGGARFVPRKKFVAVIDSLNKLRIEYTTLVNDLVKNYDEYRSQMRQIYVGAAETAFYAQEEAVNEFSIDEREQSKEAYINTFMARIETFYPAPETLRAKYSLSWDLFEMAVPKMRKGDEQDMVGRQTDADEADRIYREQFNRKVTTFVDDVVASLREQTVEICSRISENIKSGKVITGKTLKSLKTFVDRFSELNFVGDTRVEEQLATLRSEFLDRHTTDTITSAPDLQDELRRRLHDLTTVASDMTDITSITGEYRRRVSWQDEEGTKGTTPEAAA